jgi:hypothetical protein
MGEVIITPEKQYGKSKKVLKMERIENSLYFNLQI